MQDKQILSKYLSPPAVDKILVLLNKHRVVLRISRARSSKLGDYRPPRNGLPHRISVNHNLNPHEFLITLIHELAHLECWLEFGKHAKPHGREWNLLFKKLLNDFNEPDLFPENIRQAIALYTHPGTSLHQGNDVLKRALKLFDPIADLLTVEAIANGEIFIFRKRRYRKIQLVRKRIKCMCLNDNRLYSFVPFTQVLPDHESLPCSGSSLENKINFVVQK